MGTTCATKSTSNRVYTSSDDAWGNVTTRFFSGTTATLSYDALDHFTEWNAGSALYGPYGNQRAAAGSLGTANQMERNFGRM